MSMGMEFGIFLAYAAAMLIVYLAGRFLLVPVKWMGRLIVNSLAGGVLILLINWMGTGLGIFIPLNAFTAVTAGLLGVPGIVLLLMFFLL